MNVLDVVSQAEDARILLAAKGAMVNEFEEIGQVRVGMDGQVTSFFERFSAFALKFLLLNEFIAGLTAIRQ